MESGENLRTVDQWNFWRGPPELLAHVAATGARWVEKCVSRTPDVAIDVAVDDDHEVFISARDFKDSVTLQALRRFKCICLEISNPDITVTVDLRWTRPWWKPGFAKDAKVTLVVQGQRDSDVETVRQGMRSAIRRGTPNVTETTQAVIMLTFGLLTAAAVTATFESALYLLEVSNKPATLRIVAVFLGSLAVGFTWGAWVYPSIEVSPSGRTNLSRLLKTAGPVMLSIIVAGLTKQLYG